MLFSKSTKRKMRLFSAIIFAYFNFGLAFGRLLCQKNFCRAKRVSVFGLLVIWHIFFNFLLFSQCRTFVVLVNFPCC